MATTDREHFKALPSEDKVRIGMKRKSGVALLATGLLLAACGGDGGMSGDQASSPPATVEPMIAELGEWNVLPAGTLDVGDANDILRAYYDAVGGHVLASAPTQPMGMGTATWNGQWSGKIEVSSNPAVALSLSQVDLTPADLEALSGGARITAYFENSGVEATLTYMDTGLDEFGLAEIMSERAAVTEGRFRPATTEMIQAPSPIGPITFTGTFAGEGVFGGTDAEGVAGYVSGDIASSSGLGQIDIGTFKSVFHGTREPN